MKTIKQILSIAICTISLISCGREIPSDFDYGKVENNTYTNDFFGYSLEIPEEWFVQDDATKKALSEEGVKALGSEKIAKTVKAAQISTANLLMASEFDIATYTNSDVINSNFTIVVENLGMASTMVKDGKDYLDSSRKQFTQNNVPIVINSETETMKIDGKTFHYFDGVLTMQGVKINQRYMATIIKGFGFLYVATYGTDNQLEKLMDVLKTSDFK